MLDVLLSPMLAGMDLVDGEVPRSMQPRQMEVRSNVKLGKLGVFESRGIVEDCDKHLLAETMNLVFNTPQMYVYPTNAQGRDTYLKASDWYSDLPPSPV